MQNAGPRGTGVMLFGTMRSVVGLFGFAFDGFGVLLGDFGFTVGLRGIAYL